MPGSDGGDQFEARPAEGRSERQTVRAEGGHGEQAAILAHAEGIEPVVAGRAALVDAVMPAYARFQRFFQNEYRAAARSTIGADRSIPIA